MEAVKNLNKWANAHTSFPLDLLRVALGIFLIIMGGVFITNKHYLHEIILNSMQNFGSEMLLIHYIASAHMVGGIMIVFGLLTRWAIVAQLPILIGAVAVNFLGTFSMPNFVLASISLLVCVFFLFYGGGKHSA
ncbi:MAG TPA: DoxX family membrane protein, partial [Flavobacterium sp.]|uniref:DoxX family protein n=1 Tax=Flavobacterium sp. TaxID=239 RepID=UPI002BC13E58